MIIAILAWWTSNNWDVGEETPSPWIKVLLRGGMVNPHLPIITPIIILLIPQGVFKTSLFIWEILGKIHCWNIISLIIILDLIWGNNLFWDIFYHDVNLINYSSIYLPPINIIEFIRQVLLVWVLKLQEALWVIINIPRC